MADSPAQNVEMKPVDRMAEVGRVITEQAGMSLLSDAYKFPQVTSGHMQTVRGDGLLYVDGPVNGFVSTQMGFQGNRGTLQFAIKNITEAMDSQGKVISRAVQLNTGGLDTLLTPGGKLQSHTDFYGADGMVQFMFDEGLNQLTPKDGTAGGVTGMSLPDPGKGFTSDLDTKVKDAAGNYLGDIHLKAKNKGAGNVLDIVATYSFKGTYVGDVETIITVDPNNQSRASFAMQQKYDPPKNP